jgi:hypothetical protein
MEGEMMSNKEIWEQRLQDLENETISAQNFNIQNTPAFKIGYGSNQYRIYVSNGGIPKIRKE